MTKFFGIKMSYKIIIFYDNICLLAEKYRHGIVCLSDSNGEHDMSKSNKITKRKLGDKRLLQPYEMDIGDKIIRLPSALDYKMKQVVNAHIAYIDNIILKHEDIFYIKNGLLLVDGADDYGEKTRITEVIDDLHSCLFELQYIDYMKLDTPPDKFNPRYELKIVRDLNDSYIFYYKSDKICFHHTW